MGIAATVTAGSPTNASFYKRLDLNAVDSTELILNVIDLCCLDFGRAIPSMFWDLPLFLTLSGNVAVTHSSSPISLRGQYPE